MLNVVVWVERRHSFSLEWRVADLLAEYERIWEIWKFLVGTRNCQLLMTRGETSAGERMCTGMRMFQ